MAYKKITLSRLCPSLVWAFILMMGLVACEKSNNINGIQPKIDKKEYIYDIPRTQGYHVSKDLAVYAAIKFANDYGFQIKRLTNGAKVTDNSTDKTIKNVLRLGDITQKATLYLINYSGGGFVIVSGDMRVNPILAYSKIKAMPTNKETVIPGGLAWWLHKTITAVQTLRKNNKPRSAYIFSNKKIIISSYNIGWKILLEKEFKIEGNIEPPGPGTCQEWEHLQHPLLTTTWGQGVGCNNDAPNMNCTVPYNGRALAGCVAVAIAQVMKYHQYPSYYSWSSMPNQVGSAVTSDLIDDIGQAVNMNFGCSASSAYTNSVEPALENSFNYSTSIKLINYSAINAFKVLADLEAGLPVILSGSGGGVGHMWVTDGYYNYFDCNPGYPGAQYLYFYMNWGWNGMYNGLYAYADFTPGNDSFDYNSKAIINIQP